MGSPSKSATAIPSTIVLLLSSGKTHARILLVEDDDLQRSIFEAALVAKGYEVDGTSDGLSAVRMMRKVAYDLALIDYELPELDGLATAKLISLLMGEGIRPQLVALTASPEVLASRAAKSDRAFDEIVGKQHLSALLAMVERRLAAGCPAVKIQASIASSERAGSGLLQPNDRA